MGRLGHIDTPILPVSGLEEFLHVRRDQCDARRSSRGKGGSVLTYGKFKRCRSGQRWAWAETQISDQRTRCELEKHRRW